jgi:hypothetical protein
MFAHLDCIATHSVRHAGNFLAPPAAGYEFDLADHLSVHHVCHLSLERQRENCFIEVDALRLKIKALFGAVSRLARPLSILHGFAIRRRAGGNAEQ